jgi:hypothetical protein
MFYNIRITYSTFASRFWAQKLRNCSVASFPIVNDTKYHKRCAGAWITLRKFSQPLKFMLNLYLHSNIVVSLDRWTDLHEWANGTHESHWLGMPRWTHECLAMVCKSLAKSHLCSAGPGPTPSTPPSLHGLPTRTYMGTLLHWEPMWQYPITSAIKLLWHVKELHSLAWEY